MNTRTSLALLSSLTLLGSALAAPIPRAHSSAKPPSVTYRTFHYTCDAAKRVDVTYLTFGSAQDSAQFVVLKYKGATYGLSQAVSASGARYANLAGLGTGPGLEWWEWHGKAALSVFTGNDTTQTKLLLSNCAVKR